MSEVKVTITNTGEGSGATLEIAPTEVCPAGTLAKLERYEAILKYADESELSDIAAYMLGTDKSEVGKLKASLAYTASALGREIRLSEAAGTKLERMRDALERLCADAKITGLDQQAGWDCWFAQARAALEDTP